MLSTLGGNYIINTLSVKSNIIQFGEGNGPIRIDAVKTGINIAARSHFAGIRVLKDGMNLSFMFNRELHSQRIFQSQKGDENNYRHLVKIKSKEDIDKQLLTWLKEAYLLRK